MFCIPGVILFFFNVVFSVSYRYFVFFVRESQIFWHLYQVASSTAIRRPSVTDFSTVLFFHSGLFLDSATNILFITDLAPAVCVPGGSSRISCPVLSVWVTWRG